MTYYFYCYCRWYYFI